MKGERDRLKLDPAPGLPDRWLVRIRGGLVVDSWPIFSMHDNGRCSVNTGKNLLGWYGATRLEGANLLRSSGTKK